MIRSKDDILQLINTMESRTIDFKQSLFLDDKKGKDTLELCKDVSAFANTIGGQIIYGMKEEKLIATELVGIELDDPDEVVQKIENKIKDLIEPRLPGINILPIKLSNCNYAIVINISKSWLGPHGFKFDKGWRFYIRGSSQTNVVTIDQLRDLFVQSDQLIDKVRDYRNKRISEILAEAISIPLDFDYKPKLILHIIPTIAFSPSFAIDLKSNDELQFHLEPVFGEVHSYRLNFDGFLITSTLLEISKVSNYLQLFRNGIIETVDTYFMSRPHSDHKEFLGLPSIEEEIESVIKKIISVYKLLNIHSPFFVFISLLYVNGKKAALV